MSNLENVLHQAILDYRCRYSEATASDDTAAQEEARVLATAITGDLAASTSLVWLRLARALAAAFTRDELDNLMEQLSDRTDVNEVGNLHDVVHLAATGELPA